MLPDVPEVDVDRAVRSAAVAATDWRSLGPRRRAAHVTRIRRAVADRQEELAAIVAAETGRPDTEVLMQEVTAVLAAARFMEKRYPGWLRDRRFRHLVPGFWLKRNRVQLDALGVVAVVGPSNFPLSLVLMQAVAALLCGNTVVLKPSERCPGVSAAIRELFREARLPEGVAQVVEGGPDIALGLARHPEIDKVLFTGSTAAGLQIAAECARSLRPSTLELGGDAAAVVCDDADPVLAARGILWSMTYASGRSCVGTRRLLVARRVADAFREALRAEVARLPAHAVDVLARSGSRVGAGRDAEGIPVPVTEVDDEREAIRLVNEAEQRLSASVWSRDLRRAERIARELRVGIVWINDVAAGLPGMPWGGAGLSGWGRLYARLALPELTHVRCVSSERRWSSRPKFWWYPYTDRKRKTVLRGNRFLSGWPSRIP